jgi:hypothetical protein
MTSLSATFTAIYNYFLAAFPTYLANYGATFPLTKSFRLGWWNLLGNADYPCGFLMMHSGSPDEITQYQMQDRVTVSLYWVVKDKSPNIATLLVVDALKAMIMSDIHLGGACLMAEVKNWSLGTDENLSELGVLKIEIDVLIQ